MEIVRDSRNQVKDLKYERVLTMAMEAGSIMLQNGAEISRVEDTMVRLVEAYNVDNFNFFVLSNGIFTTGTTEEKEDWKSFAKVKHIPVRSSRLDIVDAVNQLSRDVVFYHYSLEQAEERLVEIENMKPKSKVAQILASGIGAAAFCIIFGGSWWDAFAALIAALIVWIFIVTFGNKYPDKILENIVGSFLVASVCLGLQALHIGDSLRYVLLGGIIPLVPGVAFVNGIRDIAEGDYLSGCVRLLDSLLVFNCIAVGSVACCKLFELLGGTVIL